MDREKAKPKTYSLGFCHAISSLSSMPLGALHQSRQLCHGPACFQLDNFSRISRRAMDLDYIGDHFDGVQNNDRRKPLQRKRE